MYPIGLIKSSIVGNMGTLAIFDLGECIGTCRFKYKKKEVILLNLKLRIFIKKERVLDSISKWVLDQECAVRTIEYHPNIMK